MNMSERIADNIKNSVVQQWNWRNKPLEVTKNGLTIDNIPYFSHISHEKKCDMY
jgi:hypothetical protein